MSLRALGTRLIKHGTVLIRNTGKTREFNTKTIIAEKINATVSSTSTSNFTSNQVIPRRFGLRNVGIQIGLQARRILIDNVLNRVTNSLAADLRKKAARRILYGDSGPFFALVGVSLASGTGILTKEEELEGVCWEIREAVSKMKWNFQDVIDEKQFENSPINLENLSFGKPLAKGSNAVVYATNIKTETNQQDDQLSISTEDHDDINKFPFALKMMFNYDIQSSAMAILNAMYRETVPARVYYNNLGISEWEIDLAKRNKHLPPHPNIVTIYSVFTDFIPELQDCRGLYPAALPKRIHPEGVGRNMSLFLLMKRYNTSLEHFLQESTPSLRTSILLFTQLLEGVAHINSNNIAHRDLKSDNLLLDTTEPEAPMLVISDFGCCLADKTNGLSLPYSSYDVDKGGNTALMAPEIMCQVPGTFSVLNYSKSDLWAAATIGYEIFGKKNPFYKNERNNYLRSATYKEENLPPMPDDIPLIFKMLIKNLLQRNPSKRLNSEVAANVCQIYLWAPSVWLKPEIAKLPSSTEILQWLLSLTTKVLCQGRINKSFYKSDKSDIEKGGRRTYPEYLLISSFLLRAKLSNIKAALAFIQDVNQNY
ncbi:serine/threonine-protein kinase Pink1, mitochondrial [Diorhabda sublineata]|uniref:serine/threonine-protein kinase Pink1, mitochondrial n=1 Tax=Diorhabda sublineata TaxID=1163346 RepID=UPI0024E13D80|nr:serine/threonine-protein kinase Pink1, mitochondrial [Diorhabda sublineata]